jgi:uncharacterized protein YyaL (SSP411 family)
MPVWGRRGAYPAVTFTVVTLAVLFAGAERLRPLIPDQEPAGVSTRPGRFFEAVAQHRIVWRALDDEPFDEARRRDRLVLLAVGSGSNWTGRAVDASVFSTDEVAQRLNREFVCVRVDSDERPEWRSALWPLSGPAMGADPGWLLTVLRPDGTPVHALFRVDARGGIDPAFLLAWLSDAQARVEGRRGGEADWAALQKADAEALLGGGVAGAPAYEAYAARLVTAMDRRNGGIPVAGAQRPSPWEWRFLFQARQTAAVGAGLGPLTRSRLVAWLTGGFYRSSDDPDVLRVRTDRLAMTNADMAVVLAEAGASGDPWAAFLARRTLRAASRGFLLEGTTWAALCSDIGDLGRSPTGSLAPRSLIESLAPKQRADLAALFGLDPRSNPSMLPFVDRPEAFLARSTEAVAWLDQARSARPPAEDIRVGQGLTNVTGTLAARSYEAARLLDDADGLASADALFEVLRRARVGTDDVVHAVRPDASGFPVATDYLAYADAAAWRFIVRGDIDALLDGHRVLRRALARFYDPARGTVRAARPSPDVPAALGLGLPCLADPDIEPLVAQALRVVSLYALVLPDEGLEEVASRLTATYGPVANTLPAWAGAFYWSARQFEQSPALVVVGPGRHGTAARLAARAPWARVVAGGPDWPDAAGQAVVFVTGRAGRQGPMDADRAVRLATPQPPGP